VQLGTRWSVGAPPPPRLSPERVAAIGEVEAELAGTATTRTDTTQWRWTLTWLEGHPIAELDDGTIVREGYDGAVTIAAADPE
jgi:hypothetical protein